MQIRLFDQPVAEFEVEEGDDGLEIARVSVLGEASLLPHGFDPTPAGAYQWLSTRALPFNRRYADKLCVAMGIRPGDVKRIVEVGMGLSLNDSYWVVPAGSGGRFEDYSLYGNGFSEALAAVAYTGKIDTSAIPQRGLTPELTTNGTLHKAWRIDETGQRLLYKGSSSGYVSGEWLSECLASQVAEVMGVRHAPYWHDRWNDEDCSVCECFCTPATSYVPFAVLARATSMAACVRVAASLGAQALEDLCDMLVFDALVCNTDRHFTNFGCLVDARTNEPVGMAPVFDNGRALFPNYGDGEVADARVLAAYSRPAFGPSSFEELAGRVLGPAQRERLLRVAENLELEAPTAACGRRCETLSAFLRARARDLSGLPLVDHEELARR